MPQIVDFEGVGRIEFPDEFTPEQIQGLLERDFGPKGQFARGIAPAVRKVGGDVAVGEPGDTHPDIIEEHGLTTDNIDQRGFVTPSGQFMDRRTAAAATGLPTEREPGNLHSTDLPAYKKAEIPESLMGIQGLTRFPPVGKMTSPYVETPDLEDLVGQVTRAPERIAQEQKEEGYIFKVPTVPSVEQHPRTPLETISSPLIFAESLISPKLADIHAQVQRSLLNNVLGLVQFAASDEGLAAGVASIIPAGRLGVEAYFVQDMARGVIKNAKEMGENWDKMTALQKAEAITNELSAMGMTAMITKAGMKTAGGQARAVIDRPFQRIPITPEKSAELQNLVISKANEGGRTVEFTDETLSKGTGSIMETMEDGSVRVNRPAFNLLVSRQINRGVKPEQAAESAINQELIHGGARTLPDADQLAEDYWNSLSWAEKWLNRRRYLGAKPTGEPLSDAELGHEAIRFQLERASSMTPLEFLAFTRSEALTSKGLTVLEDIVRSMRKKATESQKTILDQVSANVELAKKGSESASRKQEAAKIHGDVRPPTVESKGTVPVEKGGPGVLTQAEGRVEEKPKEEVLLTPEQDAQARSIWEGATDQGRIRLRGDPTGLLWEQLDPSEKLKVAKNAGVVKEEAPPSAPTVGAPAAAPAPVLAGPPGVPVVSGGEPTISTPTPVVEKAQVPGLSPERAAEYQSLKDKFASGELTPEEEDAFGAMRAEIRAQQRAGKGVAARAKEEKASPHDFIPALRTKEGQIYEGVKWKTHADIYAAQGPTGSLMLRVEQPVHGFMYKGKFISRQEVSDLLGVKEPMQSETLIEMQKETPERIGVAAISKEEEGKKEPGIAPMPVSAEAKQETEAIPEYALTAYERMSPEDQQAYISSVVPKDATPEQIDEIVQQFRDSQEAERAILVQIHANDLEAVIREEEVISPEEKKLLEFGKAELQASFDQVNSQVSAKRINILQRYFSRFNIATKPLTRQMIPKDIVGGQPVYEPPPIRYSVPTLKGFVQGMARQGIKVDPVSIQWVYLEALWDHLLNSPGDRIAEFRKGYKMEKKYGAGRVPDPSLGMEYDEATQEYRWKLTTADQEYLARMMDPEYWRRRMGRKVSKAEMHRRFLKEKENLIRDVEKNQKARRFLITQIFDRAKQEVIPPEFDPNRKSITEEEVEWEDTRDKLGRGQIGHYETFDEEAASNEAYLQSVLDDDARPGSGQSITFTKRVTVVRNRRTGSWDLLSTYRMPTKRGVPGEIMLMDPVAEPGKGKHIRLSTLPQYVTVKASMLLKDPVQNFHMRFADDPEGIRAEAAYMEAFGAKGKASEIVSNDLWEKLMRESTGKKKPRTIEGEGVEEEAELGERQQEAPPEGTEIREDLPSTGVTKGEGGSVIGDVAYLARLRQKLGDMMRFVIRGPLTRFEVEALADTLNEHEVRNPSDINAMLDLINTRSKERTLLGRKRGLTPREYIALMAIDKMAKAKFLELRRTPYNKARYKAEVIDKYTEGEARVKPGKEFNENIRMRALQDVRMEIYAIAENNRFATLGWGVKAPGPLGLGEQGRVLYNVSGFTAEALDKFGDHTRRVAGKSKVQAVAAPEVSGQRTLLAGSKFGGAPRVTIPQRLAMGPQQFPRVPGPPETLTPREQRFVESQAGQPARAQPPFERAFTSPIARVGEVIPEIPGRERQLGEYLRKTSEAQTGRQIFVPRGLPEQKGPGLLREKGTPQLVMRKIVEQSGIAARAKEGPEGERFLFGISQAVRDYRRRHGEELPAGTGEGVIGEQAVETAKAQYDQDPGKALEAIADFKSPIHYISEPGVAMVWVRSLRVTEAANKVLEDKGFNSPEYAAARKRAYNIDAIAKDMLTVWSNIGKIANVAYDVDTGNFTLMDAQLAKARKGRGFTPKEAVKAQQYVNKTKEGKPEVEAAVKKIFQAAGVDTVDPKAEAIRKTIADEFNRRAREAEARIKARREQPPPPRGLGAKAKPKGPSLPKQEMDDYVIYAADKMMKGVQMRRRWSVEMVSELGEQVRPHLDAIWNEATRMIKEETEKKAPQPLVGEVKKAVAQASAIPTREEVREEYMRVRGKKYGPNLARMLWTQAKAEYLDRGETDFDKIVGGLASYNGLSALDVIRGLAATKTLRVVSDEMYLKSANQRRVISEARNWLKNLEYPGWQRFMRKIPRVFFIDKIFGHGTVGLITHAGNMVFDPRSWGVYFPAWLDMYNFVFSPAKHEQAMKALVLTRNYATAKRYGLAVDPFKYTDDYQVQALHKLFSWGIGNRGFDALKTLRMARFNQLWDATPPQLKTPDMAREYARAVNHATGITMGRAPEWTNWVLFAPKLEGSRWGFMIGDMLRAMKTFKEWRHATPEQRMAAISEVKGKAAIVAFYSALLAMNQGILMATGSEQSINVTDPRRGDFWAFKIAGFNLGIVSPMIGMVRLFANLAHAAVGERNKVEALQTRSGQAFERVGEYVGGKFAPITQFGRNVIFQSDYRGRPMPWSEDRVPAALRRQGIDRYGWGEWLTDQFAPIPFEEAAREIWMAYGMDEVRMNDIMRALLVAGSMAATGARVSEDLSIR